MSLCSSISKKWVSIGPVTKNNIMLNKVTLNVEFTNGVVCRMSKEVSGNVTNTIVELTKEVNKILGECYDLNRFLSTVTHLRLTKEEA